MIFKYHFNKPASLKLKRPLLSLHYSGACHIIDKIHCNVPTYSHNNKRQPRVVIKGKANKITIQKGVATIN